MKHRFSPWLLLALFVACPCGLAYVAAQVGAPANVA
jgi:hypothetical protein